MKIERCESFRRLFGFGPHDYQLRVAEHLLSGRNVILQAPTGAGKTEAALFPFLHAFLNPHQETLKFPRRLVYAVPMRALARAFARRVSQYVSDHDWPQLDCRVQTGDQPDAPRFDADLVFATIDQVLSSALLVPYSLSRRQGNLNAGALACSYLVFDEFHLLDPDAALPTTLLLLRRLLRGVTPFLLMTATFSEALLDQLGTLLEATVERVSREEAAQMPSQQKERYFHRLDQPLTAQTVLETHKRRSIVVCNTVERAQALYQELKRTIAGEPPGRRPELILLHSRFYQEDRARKEELVKGGPRGNGRFSKNSEANVILVATQVIEVGLDITSDILHTELAPMSTILQRAGRCARYGREVGHVFVYRTEDLAPYADVAKLCKLTWDALADVDGKVVDFGAEQELISKVHGDHDRQMLEALAAQTSTHWAKMGATMDRQELGHLSDLIRQDDSRRVFVHPDPSEDTSPYAYETFSIYRGSLFALWRRWEEAGLTMEVPNLLRYADEIEPEVEMERQRPRFQWKPVKRMNDLTEHVVFAVHPQVVAYDSDLGFRFQEHGDASTSPQVPLSPRERDGFSYQREDYKEHIKRLLAALDRIYAREVAWPASRLEARLGLASGTLGQALRFTIACHDAGKLTQAWQRWAHEYQAGIGQPVTDEVLLAHTDYDSDNPTQREVQQRLHVKKPPHAAEGVAIVLRLAERVLPDPRVGFAALSAIARHHSPATESVQDRLNLHPRARETLAQALSCAGLLVGPEDIPQPVPLQQLRFLAKADDVDTFLVYLFLVRALRLADQASMEIKKQCIRTPIT
jgi:CRISPR-associated endonuclease/helicase Cas3